MTDNIRPLKKAAAFTDIHWGRKSNLLEHNLDCSYYVDWFCEQVKQDPEIDHIVFLGDWFDHRSSISVDTINYSHRAAKRINDLGLPVYFIVGNHDLFNRHNRLLYSTVSFNEFNNFNVVSEPTVFPELGAGGALVCPFLFHHEYPILEQYKHIPIWWGHFEFKGFIVTGHSMKMPTGPEVDNYKGPLIFSGHFHKRQANKNVVYIGNAFPVDFSDAGDVGRGMCTVRYADQDIKFIDWEECPKYQKCNLSSLLDRKTKILEGARVRCVVDIDISFEESSKLKQAFVSKYNLREFTLEESKDLTNAMKYSEGVSESDDVEIKSVDDLIMEMLSNVEAPQIDKQLLIEIYRGVHA